MTPAVEQVVAQAGVLTSFAEASQQTLKSLCGLTVGESTVERVTEAAGQRLIERIEQNQTLGPACEWPWQRDAQGRTCAYVAVDHTGVRQQGPGGARAEGRMVGVAMVYNPRSEHDPRKPPPRQVRYVSGFFELDDLGRQLRREAEAVGVMKAQQQIALSDGGSGLEAVLRKYFPNAVVILDFWHAKEHLVKLAEALHPSDDAVRQQWLAAWCHVLKHEGGPAVLAKLEALDLSMHPQSVRDVHQSHVGYFRNQVHRMDYPTYVANGWQIGSGPVESACKTVVGNRLKGGGMRWGETGANAVCHLRAAYLSDPNCWRAHWQSTAA